MRISRSWSIRTKILIPAVGGVSVVGVVLFVYFLHTIYGIQSKNLALSTHKTADFLASSLEYVVITDNTAEIQGLIDEVMSQPEVKSILVNNNEKTLIDRDKDGYYPNKYLKTFRRDIVTYPTATLLDPSDNFYSSTKTSPRIVGELVLVISNEQLFKGFYNELVLAGGFFILIFVSVLTLSLLSINSTNKAFYKIKTAIRQYQNGDMNARISLDPHTDIGKIASHFNNMAITIQEKERGLLEASSLQTRFISTMSHDLRSPLGVIIANLEMTIDREDIPATSKMNLNYCMRAASELLKLIDDIIGINKLTNNAEQLTLTDIDLIHLLRSCLSSIQYEAEESGIYLSFDNSSGHSEIWVNADANKILRIINNLLSNAVKFTFKGSVQLILSIKYKTDKELSVCIEVRDTGVGIPEENLNDIFKPFKRVTNSNTLSVPGSGLGLSIVSEYILLMDGELKVDSKENLGSVFSFNLTLPLSKDMGPPVDTENNVFDIHSLKKRSSILFIDDNEQYRKIVSQVLADYHIVVCDNGMDALHQYTQHRFSMVIVDCHMPLMDGFAVAMQIRRIEAEKSLTSVPIVALTANAVPETELQAKRSGMDDYMTKPFTKYELLSKVNKWLKLFSDEINR